MISSDEAADRLQPSWLNSWGIWTGVIIFFIGVVGIISGYFPHIWWKMTYSLLLTIILIVGIIGLALIYDARIQVDEATYSVQGCLDSQYLSQADELVNQANDILCSEKCPCNNYYKKDKVKGSAISILTCRLCESTDPEIVEVVKSLGGEYYCESTAGGTIDDFLNAAGFHQNTTDLDWLIQLALWMEEEFDCAGICTKLPFYVFTDTNDSFPEDDCRTRFHLWFNDMAIYLAFCIMIVILWFLLILIITCILCCATSYSYESIVDDDKTELEQPLLPQAE
jgi:hypothetical protein